MTNFNTPIRYILYFYMKENKKQIFFMAFFTFYILLLVWVIVFKLQFSFSLLPNDRTVNIIPLYDGNIQRISIYFGEKIYNLLLFVPFGLYVSVMYKNWSFARRLKPIFLTSLAFEVVQLLFGIGTADVTDLITNTAGGALGIGCFIFLRKVFDDKSSKIASILAMSLTLLMLILFWLIKIFIKIKLN